jgi:class 3 adenylate cyclase
MSVHHDRGSGTGSGTAEAVPDIVHSWEEQPPAPAKPAAAGDPPPAEKRETGRTSLLSRAISLLAAVSVRAKIAGTVLMVLSLAVASLGIATFARQNAVLRSELNSRAGILVRELANVGKEGLLTKQELPVFAAISDIQKRDDVVYAMVLDDEGRVFAHSELSRKGTVPTGPFDQAAWKADGLLFQETSAGGEAILDAAIPIVLKSKGLKIGAARIGLSEKALHRSIRDQQVMYLWIALGFGATGLLVSFALARLITKPLEILAEGIQVVARGDLRGLVPVTSTDEIGKVTGVFNQMILSLREKLLMEKYLSQSTVLNIREHRDVTQLKLGGERKYVTALFSDARGFTSLSEKMSPEEVVSLMNIYLNLQTTVIHQWGGIVDKFVGDEVMAIFEGRGMEINAVRAAMEIQNFCGALNAARTVSGETVISVGIGLNSGEVVMGNMGSEEHMDYTVIGDSINVAARLCGIAHPGQVLVSRAVADAVGDAATWKELPSVTVKGKDQPIGIAEPVGIRGGARRYMRKPADFTVTYTLEGFADESNTGAVRNISADGCLMEVSGPMAVGSKLHMHFNLAMLGAITVRATVYHARKQNRSYYIGLCFEDLQTDVQHRITRWIHQVHTEIAPGLFL